MNGIDQTELVDQVGYSVSDETVYTCMEHKERDDNCTLKDGPHTDSA